MDTKALEWLERDMEINEELYEAFAVTPEDDE